MNKIKTVVLLFLFLFICVPVSYADQPVRTKGISVHALPKRVAKLTGTPWGLQVSYAPYLKPEPGQPYLQSINDVLRYIRKQDPSIIKNGLWVVTTHPNSYSPEEKEFQEKIKEVLPKEKIPLFWARGSELNNGFKRY